MIEYFTNVTIFYYIFSTTALRSVADNPTLKVLLEGHHYDEGHRDYANATNTAIMVGDQIVPSMLRIECGLDCPTATTSRRVQVRFCEFPFDRMTEYSTNLM